MICPNCKKRISPFKAHDKFRCANCNAALESNARNIGLILLAIWIFIPLPLFFEMIFERFEGASTLVPIILYVAFGFAATIAGFELFGKCKISNDDTK